MRLDEIWGADDGEQREWPRYEAQKDLDLALLIDGHKHLCKLKDISLGGARLACDGAPSKADSIVIEHPSLGMVPVESRWLRDEEMGVTFDFSERALDLVSHCLSSIMNVEQSATAAA